MIALESLCSPIVCACRVGDDVVVMCRAHARAEGALELHGTERYGMCARGPTAPRSQELPPAPPQPVEDVVLSDLAEWTRENRCMLVAQWSRPSEGPKFEVRSVVDCALGGTHMGRTLGHVQWVVDGWTWDVPENAGALTPSKCSDIRDAIESILRVWR